MFQDIYKMLRFTLMIVCVVCIAAPAQAKVTAEEAARLKTELTPFGAERAGNTDGTIPAWQPMAGIPDNVNYDPAEGKLHPDPFAGDKILFTITAQNVNQYADNISPGIS